MTSDPIDDESLRKKVEVWFTVAFYFGFMIIGIVLAVLGYLDRAAFLVGWQMVLWVCFPPGKDGGSA